MRRGTDGQKHRHARRHSSPIPGRQRFGHEASGDASAHPELQPASRNSLLKLRDELRDLAARITARTHVAGRLAGAVLGHLNTVVRLLAGAVEKTGVYTKQGVPRVSSRIGVMEAVG